MNSRTSALINVQEQPLEITHNGDVLELHSTFIVIRTKEGNNKFFRLGRKKRNAIFRYLGLVNSISEKRGRVKE